MERKKQEDSMGNDWQIGIQKISCLPFIYAVHLHSTLSEMLCTVIKPGCPVVDAQANVILLVIFQKIWKIVLMRMPHCIVLGRKEGEQTGSGSGKKAVTSSFCNTLCTHQKIPVMWFPSTLPTNSLGRRMKLKMHILQRYSCFLANCAVISLLVHCLQIF